MARIRSKREAEWLAYDEGREREAKRHRDDLLAKLNAVIPADGYANIGSLTVGSVATLDYCLRCGANVIGRERHDAWHAALSG
jgi:hypothetical protein